MDNVQQRVPVVYVFGSYNIPEMTQEAFNMLVAFRNAGWNFVTKDGKAMYKDINRVLSTIGVADRSTVVSLGDALHNDYSIGNLVLEAKYSTEEKKCYVIEKSTQQIIKEIGNIEKVEDIQKNREYFSLVDDYIIERCDAAVCIWDGKSSSVFSSIMKLNVRNKPIYQYVLEI